MRGPQALCGRALGRCPHPSVRLAALHGLASVAGLEAAGEMRDRAAARRTAAVSGRSGRGAGV